MARVAPHVTAIPLGRQLPDASCNLPERPDPDIDPSRLSPPAPFLFGLAPGGVCRAAAIAGSAVSSYLAVSPLPRQTITRRGGLFSVALSLGSPPPDVIRHRMSMEPGLSSRAAFRRLPERPSGRLTPYAWRFDAAASRLMTLVWPAWHAVTSAGFSRTA